MRLLIVAVALVLAAASYVSAQQPDSGIWFGSLPTSSLRASTDERIEIETTATGAEIVSANFGKKSSTWGPIKLRQDGSIEFHWAGKPQILCVLRRVDQRNYKGTCDNSGRNKRQLELTQEDQPQGLDLPIADTDFHILAKARQILSGPAVWNRNDDRLCEDDLRQKSWSLFCSLYQASVEVTGVYRHRSPVMMEVRAVIGEVTNRRSFEHQLKDYNNLDSTSYADILKVLDATRKRLQTRAACAREHTYSRSVSKPYTIAVPNKDKALVSDNQDEDFLGEEFSRMVKGKSYSLFIGYGANSSSGKVPNGWLAASSSAKRRTYRHGRTESMDVVGRLPNGNYWRYFSQCGESAKYYDVPREASEFFDRFIKSSYLYGSRK